MLKIFTSLWVLAAALAPGWSRASTFTDLWYDPQESGWGVGIVQQDEVAFATLFVYGPDGAPTWYVASDLRITVVGGASGLPVFTGPLYSAHGPWHGGPFDPSLVRLTPVGQMTIEAHSHDRLSVHYEADGVNVTREVVRQTWRLPEIGPFYVSTFSLRQGAPGTVPTSTLQLRADVLFFVEDGMGVLRADDQLGRRCEYRGAYVQSGKLGSMAGDFTCTAGQAGEPTAGTFELTDVEVTTHGVTAFLHTTSGALEQAGRFGGVKP